MTDPRVSVRRNRRTLIVIFVLFFAPTLLAWLLVVMDWRPSSTTNHGVLVQPPEPIEAYALSEHGGASVAASRFLGHWSMLLAVDGPCSDTCLHTLDRMARVHISLNREAERVQVFLVLPDTAPAPALPQNGPTVLRLPPADVALLAPTGTAGVAAAVHLIDPQGLRMMHYPAPLDAQGLLKDVRKLLRASDEHVERSRRQG